MDVPIQLVWGSARVIPVGATHHHYLVGQPPPGPPLPFLSKTALFPPSPNKTPLPVLALSEAPALPVLIPNVSVPLPVLIPGGAPTLAHRQVPKSPPTAKALGGSALVESATPVAPPSNLTPAQQREYLTSLGPPTVAFRAFCEACPDILVETTRQNIRGMLTRYEMWASPKLLDPWDEENICNWLLENRALLPSTKSTYKRQFDIARSWILAPAARRFRETLLIQGANIPTHQAPALPRDVLFHPRLTRDRHKRMQLWLAWKTASRWSDLTRLETADFCVMGADTLMVDFGTKTKMTRKNPFRKSRFAVIQGPIASELIARVSSLQDPIQWMTTAEVSAALKIRSFPHIP